MNILSEVRKSILRSQLLSRNERILVGVSGGADSVFLLYALQHLQAEFTCHLCVAHLNHGLRKSSDADERFVMKLAEKLNVPVITKKINLKKAKQKGSLEEIAREARLNFLIQAAQKNKCSKIALGHTKDDLAETVLMRILRGAGMSGLRAILPKRQLHAFTVIRPLLQVSRPEIEDFLKTNRIAFRNDPTNKDLIFFRNKIRLKLLPHLGREYNSDIKNVLSHLAQNMAVDYDFLSKKASKAYKNIAKKQGKRGIRLNLPRIKKLHPSLQRSVIRAGVSDLKGNTNKLTFAHWEEIDALIHSRPVNAQVHLPHHVKAVKKSGELVFTIRKS